MRALFFQHWLSRMSIGVWLALFVTVALAQDSNRVPTVADGVETGRAFVVVAVTAETGELRLVEDSTQPIRRLGDVAGNSRVVTADALRQKLNEVVGELFDATAENPELPDIEIVVLMPPTADTMCAFEVMQAGARAGIANITLMFPAERGFEMFRYGLPRDEGLSVAPVQPIEPLRIRFVREPETDRRAVVAHGPTVSLRFSLGAPTLDEQAVLDELVGNLIAHAKTANSRIFLDSAAGIPASDFRFVLRAIELANAKLDADMRLAVGFALPSPRGFQIGRGTGERVPARQRSVAIEPPSLLEEIPDSATETPTVDPRILEDARDDQTDDPSETPDSGLRPTPDNPGVESPFPTNPGNPGMGLGGNFGTNGNGRGGNGEFNGRRARGGGGHAGDQNVLLALRWLRDHQNEDGSWSPDGFADVGKTNGRQGDYGNKDGSADTGFATNKNGVTGLALLAFLGAGYTHIEGEFHDTVKRALRYLKTIQDNEGCFGSRDDHHFIYGHATASMAMIEAYGMTGSIILKGPAQKAVDFIAHAQNHDGDRGFGGWRYGVQPGDNDTSVTGWMVMALKSAKLAGLDVPERCFEGALRHLDDMTGTVNGYPKTGYLTRGGQNARLMAAADFLPNPAMDAINVYSRLIVANDGRLRADATLRAQAAVITSPENLPTLDDPNQRDYYYWYYGTLAMFQMGGTHWAKWQRAMHAAVVGSQRLDGEANAATHGSWDTTSAWGLAGGRVYTTAINCLTLETVYRYQRLAEPGENRRDERRDDGDSGDGR